MLLTQLAHFSSAPGRHASGGANGFFGNSVGIGENVECVADREENGLVGNIASRGAHGGRAGKRRVNIGDEFVERSDGFRRSFSRCHWLLQTGVLLQTREALQALQTCR